MVRTRFKLSDAGFRKLEKLNGGANGAWRSTLKKMAKRYEGFTKRWFATEGGGSWPDLKETTKKRRRKGRGRGGPKVLVDTGVLRRSLIIGDTGNYLRYGRFSVEYGFANKRHPEARGLTIRKLAVIHQEGSSKRNLPARPILVEPDSQTKRAMVNYVRQGERKMLLDAERAALGAMRTIGRAVRP